MSQETFETKEACQAKLEERVEAGNKLLIPQGVVIRGALCATEDEFKRLLSQQDAEN